MADIEAKPATGDADNNKQNRGDRDNARNDRDRRDGRNGGHRGGGRGGGRGRGNNRGGQRGRGGSRGGHRNFDSKRDDRKTRHDVPSDDPDEIRNQIEFYFSDSNLSKDKFLFEQTGGPENKPIDVDTIASFSLMRRFRPIEAVVKALKESDTLDISESNQITRKTPLVTLSNDFEENKKLLAERALPNTLYVKGFRIDSDYRDSQRKVQEFFKPYGIVEVRLRRLGDAQKLFKGSVYAEFPDVDSAEQFRTKKHHFEGRDLEVLFKKDYIKREVDLVMEDYDVSDLAEDIRENAITEGRKVLEQEYMEPQAPLIGKSGNQPQEDGAATKDIQDRVAKAKAKYVEKQDKVREQRRKEREAEQGSRNRDKRRDNNNDNQKRPREDDQQDEEPESKRPRDDAANGEAKAESGAADVKADETTKTETTENAEPKAEATAEGSADANAAAAE